MELSSGVVALLCLVSLTVNVYHNSEVVAVTEVVGHVFMGSWEGLWCKEVLG